LKFFDIRIIIKRIRGKTISDSKVKDQNIGQAKKSQNFDHLIPSHGAFLNPEMPLSCSIAIVFA
jgi:hypothetical protein